MVPFSIHCKFCSPMTRLGCRIAALGVGVMVRVGLLVRTELASRGRVWTMAGRGSVVGGTLPSPGTLGLGLPFLGTGASQRSRSVGGQMTWHQIF